MAQRWLEVEVEELGSSGMELAEEEVNGVILFMEVILYMYKHVMVMYAT